MTRRRTGGRLSHTRLMLLLPALMGVALLDTDPGGTGGGDPAGGGTPRTFDQAELDRIVQREKAQAVAARERVIAEALGCTVEEAKAKIAAAAAAEAAALSEAERRQKAADEAKAAADKAAADAAALRRDTLAERHLVRSGFVVPTGDQTAAAEALAYGVRLLAGLPATADETAIAAEVATLKTRLPSLFGATGGTGSGGDAGGAGGGTSGGGGAPPSSDAPAPHRPGTPDKPWGAAGLDRARQRGYVKEPAATS